MVRPGQRRGGRGRDAGRGGGRGPRAGRVVHRLVGPPRLGGARVGGARRPGAAPARGRAPAPDDRGAGDAGQGPGGPGGAAGRRARADDRGPAGLPGGGPGARPGAGPARVDRRPPRRARRPARPPARPGPGRGVAGRCHAAGPAGGGRGRDGLVARARAGGGAVDRAAVAGGRPPPARRRRGGTAAGAAVRPRGHLPDQHPGRRRGAAPGRLGVGPRGRPCPGPGLRRWAGARRPLVCGALTGAGPAPGGGLRLRAGRARCSRRGRARPRAPGRVAGERDLLHLGPLPPGRRRRGEGAERYREAADQLQGQLADWLT